ncbi:MAG: hypothetical protein QNJ64_19680 [Crocosphaera sp.]|nr:hypothetical protein [Crocosphaera sp.]
MSEPPENNITHSDDDYQKRQQEMQLHEEELRLEQEERRLEEARRNLLVRFPTLSCRYSVGFL